MKINKIVLKISHFFGFRKSEEHIDDVTINISSSFYSKDEIDIILFNEKTPDYIVSDIKEKAYQILKDNPKIEQKCRKSNQLWLTFYESINKKNSGGLMKMCYYTNGTLFYPCDTDRKSLELIKKFNVLI